MGQILVLQVRNIKRANPRPTHCYVGQINLVTGPYFLRVELSKSNAGLFLGPGRVLPPLAPFYHPNPSINNQQA